MGSVVTAVAVQVGVSGSSGSSCTHVAVTARLALTGTISFRRDPRLPITRTPSGTSSAT
jgi:hypothetical protein